MSPGRIGVSDPHFQPLHVWVLKLQGRGSRVYVSKLIPWSVRMVCIYFNYTQYSDRCEAAKSRGIIHVNYLCDWSFVFMMKVSVAICRTIYFTWSPARQVKITGISYLKCQNICTHINKSILSYSHKKLT